MIALTAAMLVNMRDPQHHGSSQQFFTLAAGQSVGESAGVTICN